ncbi:MAG: TonB-dependent receptor family protein [Bacteroidales bacterium]|nr:TonB-dependent receptor family protein [Bacteroidales bacterium]
MKKLIVSLLSALLFCLALPAQHTVVSGAVLDSLSRQGEPAAVLQFFHEGDSDKPVAFTTTDTDGRFSQVLSARGTYTLLFTGVGRLDRRVGFTLEGQETLDLGEILVRDDVQALKSASVTAQRPLVRMEVDRMSYNVADDVDSKTSTVLEMLRKVPMVTVDGQDNITVNGSSSFQVTVDGKPSQMFSGNPSQIFKMMPASSVKDIQVITNPGVRYDAEGVGGVLNLVTNREATGGQSVTDGYYGSVRAMGSTRGGGGGLFISQQKGKFAWSLNGNGMYMKMPGTTTDVTREMTGAVGGSTRTHSESAMTLPMGMGNLSASYDFDSRNLVSITAGLMHFGTTMDGLTSTLMSGGFYGTGFSYDGTSYMKMSSNAVTAGIDYQHLWADNPNRNFVLSYQFSGSPAKTLSENTFRTGLAAGLDLTDRRTDGRQGSTDHTVQADFITPLGASGTLSAGSKFIARHNSSDQLFYLWDGTDWALSPSGSLDYDFYNRIGALYTEYKAVFGAFSLLGGVRYEHTWQEVTYAAGQGNDFSTQYGSFVPTASIQWNLGMTSNIGLSYNMRISRPGISYLNPYVDISDPTARSYGNSELEVERGHNLSLVYNLFSPKWILNLTLRESLVANGISPYSFYDADQLLNTTFGNIVRSSMTGLNVFANWNAGPKTRIFLNGGLNYSDFSSAVLDQHNSGLSYNAMLGFQQTLPADFQLSANVMAMGRSYSLQGWSTGMSMGMAGLTKTFLDDRLGISINYTMPLTGGRGLEMRSYTSGKDFRSESVNVIPMQNLNLSISWNFGRQGGARVKSTRTTILNDDVLNAESTTESLGTSLMGGGTGTGTGSGGGIQ